MRISIGCDHIVTEVKDHFVKYLAESGHEVIDNGTHDKERTHYPIYGKKTAEKVVLGAADLGIVICGTGVGISVSANKVQGARAALVRDVEAARYAKENLHANIIAMGGRITGIGLMEDIVDAFIKTKYKATPEEEEVIKKIDRLVGNEEQLNNDHYFDEFIDKWEQGAYQD
ncbi:MULTISPECIES: galactose-6-phosphate isomerase subunit LacB [Virgibacillus]|uniref:Galactose-6-phosphate isomerase subunit LacB n=1 Tax=Virgibacillus dokdonensis TaxID=302167 RepID=A0A2K9IWQ1_9BACI|nr:MULTISPECIES: galactose-6-phosphate isomerase subunit LacB [Virgibacillus]AUJ24188.1 Galactose-6-phosphate isomerase subunit LacB [Virgibacillus dokdonensis]NWO12445.1 galactose-6-phosphate isomerase subunit LacB [Virgibacillus sp.]